MIWQQHALTIRKLAAWKYELAAKANYAHEIFAVVMLLAITVPLMAMRCK